VPAAAAAAAAAAEEEEEEDTYFMVNNLYNLWPKQICSTERSK